MKKLLLILYSLLMLFVVSCSQQQNVSKWQSDLEIVKSEILIKDVGLIENPILSQQFEKAINQIISDLPKYHNEDQIFVDLSGAIASIGQLHTYKLIYTKVPIERMYKDISKRL